MIENPNSEDAYSMKWSEHLLQWWALSGIEDTLESKTDMIELEGSDHI